MCVYVSVSGVQPQAKRKAGCWAHGVTDILSSPQRHTHTDTHTFTHIHTHTHTHTDRYTHTQTHTQSSVT